MSTIYLPVQAGVMISRCPTREKGWQCNGIMRIPITLKEAAKIRHGHRKSLTASFSCRCKWNKVIVS